MKFNSELDMNDPADNEEAHRRVFGIGYTRDKNGKPIELSALTPAYVKRFPDRGESHANAVGKNVGVVDEVRERTRLGLHVTDVLLEKAAMADAERKARLKQLGIVPREVDTI